MSTIASQITSPTNVYSTVYSGADQRKHQSSASLAFVQGIHQSPVNSPHKWPVTRKMFPFDDVILSGCTGNCHVDDFQCSEWRKLPTNEDIFVSRWLQCKCILDLSPSKELYARPALCFVVLLLRIYLFSPSPSGLLDRHRCYLMMIVPPSLLVKPSWIIWTSTSFSKTKNGMGLLRDT